MVIKYFWKFLLFTKGQRRGKERRKVRRAETDGNKEKRMEKGC